jgi:hypothetical protein
MDAPRRRPGGRLTTAGLLAVVNGALVGIGSVYLTTHSTLITLIAAASAVILAGLSLRLR